MSAARAARRQRQPEASGLPARRRAPYRRGRRLSAAVAVLGVLTAATVLTGCEDEDERAGCAWTKTQAPTAEAGSTVVLVDGSASVHVEKAGSRGPDYGRTVDELLDKDDEQGETVSIGTFGGSSGDVVWTVQERPGDWQDSNDNPRNQELNRQAANGCLRDDLATAQRTRPVDGGTDVLAALAAGAEMLSGAEGERHLLVLSDGLSTTGCADLRGARFGSAQDIKSIVSVCGARGEFSELPRLSGVKVTFVGLGHSAGGQPSADTAQRVWLRKLWTTLCERAGGTCDAEDASVMAESPAPARPGSPGEPVVHYGDSRSRTITLPGAALFDTDSPRLRRAAVPTLADVAATARTTPSLDRVVVNGYVDPRGGSGNDRELSQDRADAVRKVLVDHGVPASRVTAHGLGRSPGCPESEGKAAGAMTREQRLQCDRRVDIEIIRK
ncbi:OmpA family protein [Streptomyces massasporeus]|uniref:OmpA family protein n=1 Tax=Streptomyces massasporeus TaxID=67324 RepID=UPI0036EE54F1